MMGKRLESKTALVTGASSGIGKAVALLLAYEGASVVAVGRNEERLKGLCREIADSGGKAHYLVCDLSQSIEREKLDEGVSRLGHERLNILINAAGIQKIQPIMNSKPEFWRDLMEINVIAPADLVRRFLPRFSKKSSVVNIASVAAAMAVPGSAEYGATKAALVSFTRTAAAELVARGIRVNAVLPGMVQTPMLDQMKTNHSKEQWLELERRHPLGFGTPDAVAQAVGFLVSDEAAWITGASLVVDGGFSLKS